MMMMIATNATAAKTITTTKTTTTKMITSKTTKKKYNPKKTTKYLFSSFLSVLLLNHLKRLNGLPLAGYFLPLPLNNCNAVCRAASLTQGLQHSVDTLVY